jgi:Ala-tRNA(Pro) deacylase
VSRTPVTERLERWLREAGVAFEIFEHAPVHTSEEAARVRRTPLEAGAKALVVRADDLFVHCVLPAHLKADNALLRGLVGTRKLRFATPEELQTLTGCAPGAVPPFGNLFGLRVLMDEALARNERVAFNAGSNTVSITMRCDDLVRLSEATMCRFAADPL